MTILSKACKPDNFEWHNSLKLSFTNILGLCLNFVDCKSFLESNSWHSCSVLDKPGWLEWFWHFLCERLSSFNPKGFYYSYTWSCSLCEGRTSFCTGLISRKLYGFLFMFSTDIKTLVSYFFFLYWSPLSLCTVFDPVSLT